jgi:dipeptidyl-peptidase-4
VGVVAAAGGATTWFAVPGEPRDHYLPKMEWAASSEQVIIQQLNRLQNTNTVMLGDVADGAVHTILVEQDEAWLDLHNDLQWLDEGAAFTWISERDGWRHLYRVSRDGQTITLLTPGDYDVISVQKIDAAGGWVYFIASPDNPTQRYLYRVPLDGRGTAERLSPADQPGTHSYQISSAAQWAFHTVSSFDRPPVVSLVSLPEHDCVRPLQANQSLHDKVKAIHRQPVEFFRVAINDGILLDGWCIKPPDFDPQQKYPVLFYVYGEPAGQTVKDEWPGVRGLWHQMLAQQGYVVMSVDNRGTPAPRGRGWRKCLYRQIGVMTTADQAAAVKQIVTERPYLDPNRIAVWGWSGGGTMTLNAMFRYPDVYCTGIAVAPVSDFHLYDTVYEERYMGVPSLDAAEDYVQGSPITFAHQLAGNLLIIHGTGDDNVHYQSTERLVNELIKHNKPFSMMAYPNRSHAIKEGDNTQHHLYGLITRYLQQNL